MAVHPSIDTHSDNLPVLTVSEISQALKRHVEDRFDHVRVRGEISGFKPAASGHLYFVLKDADAVLEGVCWRGTAQSLSVRPEDGLEVIATGRLTTYPGRSRYQMIVEAMEAAGAGALLKLLEERRQRLAAEGLFDAARKRPIPFLPAIIGVITSPTGAVIRDILHRISDRCPRRVVVWPVAVQGQGAAEQIAAAVAGFNALAAGGPVPRPDVLIVARGGGSIEDLWAFNEEAVVRAVAASRIPVISAVGHETDTTLDRPCRRPAGADTERRRRDGGAGAHRAGVTPARHRLAPGQRHLPPACRGEIADRHRRPRTAALRPAVRRGAAAARRVAAPPAPEPDRRHRPAPGAVDGAVRAPDRTRRLGSPTAARGSPPRAEC